MRDIRLFALISYLYSWPLFFVIDAWLVPRFLGENNTAAAWLTAYFGHSIAMAGPALAAILMWRRYHKEPLPSWRWSRPGYYGLVALAMLALWTLPAVLGLIFGDRFHLRKPLEMFAWVIIGSSFTIEWLAGLGEELGWTAYLLPRLAPRIGKSRALVVAGAIRGLWHWPVVVGPLIYQVFSGEKTIDKLVLLSVVFALQLIISNALFSSLFGWVWYRTESLPLMGWMHQWFDATRDVTALVIVGYANSVWFTMLWGIPFYTVAGWLLMQEARDEGANLYTLAPTRKG